MAKILGFDYGTKPSLMVVGDYSFPDLLRRGLVGLGYSLLPEHGLLVNPPLLVMIFNDLEIAKEVFEHFHGWCEGETDGDAVGITFIEYDSGEYGLCMYQEPKALTRRLVPEPDRSEYQILSTLASHLKLFPEQSQHYQWFKSVVSDRTFLLAAGTTDGRLLPDTVLRKSQVAFYSQHEIPEQSLARTFADPEREESPSEPRPLPQELKLAPADIGPRRKRQLRRFFPVTLESLTFSSEFRAALEHLKGKGYREWQILQAACNVALRHRIPELFRRRTAGQGQQEASPLAFLLLNAEQLPTTSLPPAAYSLRSLSLQIHADMRNLFQYLGSTELAESSVRRTKLLKALDERRLLDAPEILSLHL